MANSLTGKFLATIPETTAGRTSRLQFPSHVLSGECVPQGYCVLFDFIQSEAVVTCHKHGISTLVPETLCRGDSFAAQLNATP